MLMLDSFHPDDFPVFHMDEQATASTVHARTKSLNDHFLSLFTTETLRTQRFKNRPVFKNIYPLQKPRTCCSFRYLYLYTILLRGLCVSVVKCSSSPRKCPVRRNPSPARV